MSLLSELSERIPGRAHGPGASEYDSGRTVFAGVGEPEAVVRPHTAEEVAAAVGLAAAAGLPIAVRSGGHGLLPVDGGLVVDLAEFTAIEVDAAARVSVGGGARWGDVAAALAPHGLGISSGDTRDVGVGGLALGGGIGWLVRMQGLAIDALREVELVTAAGEVLTVNETSHPEFFWALRGGGGNFGVVTRFVFQAVPADGLVAAHVGFDRSDVPALLRAWRDVMRASPDELNSSLMLVPPFGPEMPGGPQLGAALQGSEARLRELLAPLLELPSVTEAKIGPSTYGELLEDAPPGRPPFRFVGGNGFVPELSDAALDAVAAAYDREVPTMVLLRALGGAFSRVAPDATAIAFRDAEALLIVNAVVAADAPPELITAVEAGSDAALAFTSGVYGNFSAEYGDGVTAAMYPPATLERLRRIKAQVDPGNVFRRNHNIAPTS
ncbi:FAD-binding oxidoreductase [Agromyces cerinus]|uniref:FAD/FMN-containing dehydrogenase n=1 Tax=Agromyces cerinus subsp. cerinus TaxID=232089 RepID=A0A1N6G8B4_9MICO|nr:FAD-binding oxidoreductase [Agromyces cerinus]SIO03799.1 FAD/FMN-containing dehydrogenase [Agromyces cerinus subsp. cerinus]